MKFECKRKVLMIVTTSIFLPILSSAAYANAESNAKIACERYAQVVPSQKTSSNQSPMAFICEHNEHNASEWGCMYEKQINQHWTFEEASGTCLKKAPALAYYTQKGGSLVANTEPKNYCEPAMAKFSQINPLQNDCPMSSRTALEWYCMLNFANDGDSFMYASGQCFKS